MRKDDVETHHIGYGSDSVPAINVKVYHMGADNDDVAEYFKCDPETAERALGFAFESAQQVFWEMAGELAEEIWGKGHKVYSEGHSGGWLYVQGLEPLEHWNARDLAKWSKFKRLLLAEIEYRTKRETLFDDIAANEWAKPGAEMFNFVDTPQGTRNIADMKAEAIKAGYGPVIRKG
jgi:hypothetical protein